MPCRASSTAAKARCCGGLLFLLLSAAVGFAITWWLVVQVRKLRSYAQHVQGPTLQEAQGNLLPPKMPEVPDVPGELGDLAQAMDSMRRRLEGRDYIEGYVRALTHELKSPVAAIRGAGELPGSLPAADRAMFAQQVVDQSLRLQNLIDQLMQLSQLEQRSDLAHGQRPHQPARLRRASHGAAADHRRAKRHTAGTARR